MKIPNSPPPLSDLIEKHRNNLSKIFETDRSSIQTSSTEYYHWDDLQYRKHPTLSREEWWLLLKLGRSSRFISLLSCTGDPFWFGITDRAVEKLHQIDCKAGGKIEMPNEIINKETKDRYLIGSLIEEAITSSQLEGAVTTRRVAKQMIREGRTPKNESERMILNNFRTMQEVSRLQNEPLTPELVFNIHRLITEGTLDNPEAAGRFRTADELVQVVDHYGQVLHDPPPASQLKRRLDAMCRFANEEEDTDRFIHPIVRSIILHFWLAYDHPFVDGNGRTARALFYWSMLKHGYWLTEFISISQIIIKARSQYGRAFLLTETDSNDLTYFILYHLDIIDRAIDKLYQYIKDKTAEVRIFEKNIRASAALNHRQRALLSHALRHPNNLYTIQSHQVSHNVVYQTARTDLLDLVKKKLLISAKGKKKRIFQPVPDLEKRLAKF